MNGTNLTQSKPARPSKFMVTLFADKKGHQILQARKMWLPEVEQLIRDMKPRPTKDSLPLLKFAGFGTKRSDNNSLRYDGNIEHVSGIEGDCDDDVTPMEDAIDRLKSAGIASLFYTSASHMAGHHGRWRVLCPLATPIEGTEDELRDRRKHWVGVLNAFLGGVLKGESFSLSQSYYYGPLQDNLKPTIKRIDGCCIDELTDPPEPRFPTNGAAGHQVPTAPKPKDTSRSADLLHEVRGDVSAGLDDEAIHEKRKDHPHCLKFKRADKVIRAIQRCIDKARENQLPKTKPEEDFGKKKTSLIVDNAGEMEEMAIEWIVPDYLPRGMLSCIAGYGGEGKSIILTTILAPLSRGVNFITGEILPRPISMLIITEEPFQQLTLPRLNFNNADTSRIGRIRGVSKPKGEESWNLVEHMNQVREYLMEHREVELLVIDPIGNYMSGKARTTDSTQDGDVRNVLRPWQELAEELNMSILYLAHFNKTKTSHIHEKVTGSTAFVTSTRITYGVGKMAPERVQELGFTPIDPSQGSYRVLFPIKGNIGILPAPLLFKFEKMEGTVVPKVTVEKTLPHGFEVMLAEDVLTKPSQRNKLQEDSGPTNADRAMEAITSNPGIIQQALALQLRIDKSNLRPVLQRLEGDGKIVRIRTGKERQLYTAEDAALFA
jgi:hypothetical protein